MTVETEAGKQKKDVCLTHHERLDADSGMVLVSAAIRQVEGNAAPTLIIMVPTGLAIAAGVQVKIGDGEVLKLPYTLCTAAGCAAEIEAPADLIDGVRHGKELIAAALNVAGTALGFPVPLTGLERRWTAPRWTRTTTRRRAGT